jgi:hypothetical protein
MRICEFKKKEKMCWLEGRGARCAFNPLPWPANVIGIWVLKEGTSASVHMFEPKSHLLEKLWDVMESTTTGALSLRCLKMAVAMVLDGICGRLWQDQRTPTSWLLGATSWQCAQQGAWPPCRLHRAKNMWARSLWSQWPTSRLKTSGVLTLKWNRICFDEFDNSWQPFKIHSSFFLTLCEGAW